MGVRACGQEMGKSDAVLQKSLLIENQKRVTSSPARHVLVFLLVI